MNTPIEDTIKEYEELGFDENKEVITGTGSRILINESNKKVIKINQDPAYDSFVEFALNNPSLKFPHIYSFTQCGVYPYNTINDFSVIEMEKLYPLDDSESEKYMAWIQLYEESKNVGDTVTDDFGLLNTIQLLYEYADKNESIGIGIDLSDKSANVMKTEEGCYVVTDPYNVILQQPYESSFI